MSVVPRPVQDQCRHDVLCSKSYSDLYRDLRTAVDMCHRDGSLKKAVAANPAHFIHSVGLWVDGLGEREGREGQG